MVFFNYATKQMAAKIVYYGPGLCGKTTNLQYIYNKTSPKARGEMVSLATETDRTLFFDLLPLDVGTIAGFRARFQLYTVPGQVFYNSTRRLVLKGVDAIVFIADSQKPMLDANMESFKNMIDNLSSHNLHLQDIPYVIQYNKRDLPNILDITLLNKYLNKENVPYYEAIAITGKGVINTLKGISKLTIRHLRQKAAERERARGHRKSAKVPIATAKTMPKSAPVKTITREVKTVNKPVAKEAKHVLTLKEKLALLKENHSAESTVKAPAKPLQTEKDIERLRTEFSAAKEKIKAKLEIDSDTVRKAQKPAAAPITQPVEIHEPKKGPEKVKEHSIENSLDNLKRMLLEEPAEEAAPAQSNDEIDSMISSLYAGSKQEISQETMDETESLLTDYLTAHMPEVLPEIKITKDYQIVISRNRLKALQDAILVLNLHSNMNKTPEIERKFKVDIAKGDGRIPNKIILNLSFIIQGSEE